MPLVNGWREDGLDQRLHRQPEISGDSRSCSYCYYESTTAEVVEVVVVVAEVEVEVAEVVVVVAEVVVVVVVV